jgi:tRNA pseudouridine55 synthase
VGVRLEGLLNIGKKRGIRSFEVVVTVRRLTRERRVGHTGTLDQGAAGVLIVLVGRATKLARFLVDDEKEYYGTIRLGESTDTDDSTGRVISRGDSTDVTEDLFREVAREFVGEMEQVPPAYSCVRVGGMRLHERARKGLPSVPVPRRVRISELEVTEFTGNEAVIRVVCSKGTYIRALARDIGERLGCKGHLHDLVRLRVGDNLLENSIDIDSVSGIEEHIVQMKDALGRFPIINVTPQEALCLRSGKRVDVPADRTTIRDRMVRLCDNHGELVGVGKVEEELLVPVKILS